VSTDLVAGRITQFRREQGFGTITLDDGREIPFDAQICELSPEEGMRVRVQVGKAKWGNKDKAVIVKPESDAAIAALIGGGPAMPLDVRIGLIQAQQLIAGLTPPVLARIAGALGAGAPALAVLDRFYAEDPASAAVDGYVRVAAVGALEPEDVLASIARVLPAAPLPRQVRWERGPAGWTLHMVLPGDAELPLDVTSIDDVVEVVNGALAGAEVPQRLWALTTNDPSWHAYLALTAERVRELALLLPLVVR
jgi:hypothetical protein